MEEVFEEKYRIGEAADWAGALSKAEILARIVESDFSQQQYEEGKDFCYFLQKVHYTDDTQIGDYNCMAYTVQQPGTLEFASVNEFLLYPGEQMIFHRIAVLRDGVWIDKLPDTKFKVLDHEGQSISGTIHSAKKVHIRVSDVRLYDILIIADTRLVTFTEKDFLRKELTKHVWTAPDVYWAYGSYSFSFVNQRRKAVAYKKQYFRDAQQELLPVEEGQVAPGETFSLAFEQYINSVDINREIAPFIDFATAYRYEELLEFLIPHYEEALQRQALGEYAPDLVAKLDAQEDMAAKIQFAIEFAQSHIRYLYNEEEMHGHKPQEPAITYKYKQGDCKAKVILLKAMLDYLGVESSVLLVNLQADIYLQRYLPSLLNFNHVILKIHWEGQDYFVDATLTDEYGSLENRGQVNFQNYLEVKRGCTLQERPAYRSPNFAVDEEITLDVQGELGTIRIETTYRYGRANTARRYMKATNKQAIIDSTNNFVYRCMDFDEKEHDKRVIFKDATSKVLSDDKVSNTITILYTATVDQPYFIGADRRKYLRFYDGNVVKRDVADYLFKDVGYWHAFDSERYRISIRTDQAIDTQDVHSMREMEVTYDLFTYSLKKKLEKFEAQAEICYRPQAYVEVPVAELPKLREEYLSIGRTSAYGLGVVLERPSLWKRVKGLFALVCGSLLLLGAGACASPDQGDQGRVEQVPEPVQVDTLESEAELLARHLREAQAGLDSLRASFVKPVDPEALPAVYPDYYGGAYVTDDAYLMVYIAGEEHRPDIIERAGTDRVKFAPQQFSYAYLLGLLQQLQAKDLAKEQPELARNVVGYSLIEKDNIIEVGMVECNGDRIAEFQELLSDSPALRFKQTARLEGE